MAATVEEVIKKKDVVKVLLAEDYKHSQIIVTRLLKKNNFENIVVVENGEEAVNIAKQELPLEIREKSSSLYDILKKQTSIKDLIKAILGQLEGYYGRFIEDGLGGLIKEWKQRCSTLNTRVKILLDKMTVALKSDLRQIGTMKIGGIGGIILEFAVDH